MSEPILLPEQGKDLRDYVKAKFFVAGGPLNRYPDAVIDFFCHATIEWCRENGSLWLYGDGESVNFNDPASVTLPNIDDLIADTTK
jgi:hypothetical protein